MAQLDGDLGGSLAVHEIDDAFPGGLMRIGVQARYCAIGETTTRLHTCMPRKRNGTNMGARACVAALPVAVVSNHFSAPSSHVLSRARRFSWLIRCDRVNSE